MIKCNDGDREELLSQWLIHLDEELACGISNPSSVDASSIADDAGQIEQWEADRHCLELLHRVRRHWAPDGLDTRAPANEVAAATPVDGMPRTLGRFRILRELGSGGMGVVYLAYDPTLHRQVALKVPRPESLLSADLRRRFLREAEAAAQLNHPHLVIVYDSAEHQSVCYIASEFCPGPTLAQWLTQLAEPLPARSAALLIKQLAEAVGHAHGRGVLHRDIKPSNVLLAVPEADTPRPGEDPQRPRPAFSGPNERKVWPKLTDFGMAKLLERDACETRSGALVGTPAYMAPEQARGSVREQDARTDIYALGAILYEVLTRRRVFECTSDIEALRRVLFEEPVSPRRIRSDIPRDLEAICLKCLAKSSDARYATAQQLVEDLDRFLKGRPTAARPLTAAARTWRWAKRRPALAALAGIASAAAAAVFAIVLGYNARLADEIVRADAARDVARRESANSRQLLYSADVRVAYETVKAKNVVQAMELLERHIPKPGETDLREFAWHYLREQCQPSTLNLQGHKGDVFGVAFSPGGNRLATAGKDKTARIWNAETGELRHTLGGPQGHTDEVTSVAFSPDGNYLATASEDTTIRFWNVRSGRRNRILAAHTDHVLCIAFSPDGKRLASGGRDGTVRLWDLATNEVVATHQDLNVVRAVAFSPSGEQLLAGDEAGTLHVWNLGSDDPAVHHTVEHEKIFALAVSHDASLVAAAGRFEHVHFWNSADLARGPQDSRGGHTDWVQSLAFSPGDSRLASGGKDGVIHLWNPGEPGPQRTLLGHRSRVWSVAWSPDAQRLASAGADGVRIWSLSDGFEPAYEETGHPHSSVDFFPGGRRLITLSNFDGIARIWQRETHKVLDWFGALQRGDGFEVRVSPDGKLIATRGKQQLKIWRGDSLKLIHSLACETTRIPPLAWAPSGNRLATTTSDNTVAVFDADTLSIERQFEHETAVQDVAFTCDGRYLATTSQSLTIWDLRHGGIVYTIPESHSAVIAGRDCNLIAAAAGPNITVIDLTIEPPRRVTIVTAGNAVTSLALSGPTLAAIFAPASGVSLYDIRTRQLLMELPCDAEHTNDMAFSPDGSHLVVVGNRKGTIWEWTVRKQ